MTIKILRKNLNCHCEEHSDVAIQQLTSLALGVDLKNFLCNKDLRLHTNTI